MDQGQTAPAARSESPRNFRRFKRTLPRQGMRQPPEREVLNERNLDTCGQYRKSGRMVPGARIELATPAFSGRRSTSELPRHADNFSILGTRLRGVKCTKKPGSRR